MEPAKIDWKSIESVFVRDDTYENINAPQWTDFLVPDNVYVDDEAWFCRSDCKHPKTAEDFLRSAPTSKLLRSASVSKLIGDLGDWNWGKEVNLKRRGGQFAQVQSSSSLTNESKCSGGGGGGVGEDGENQNPNLATPRPNRPVAAADKAAIKSSAEKKYEENDCTGEVLMRPEENRRLKSTLSARDLFGGGRDIMGKITDFCNELKRMATSRVKEMQESNDQGESKEANVSEKGREGKPLLVEVVKSKEERHDEAAAGERSNVREQQQKKKKLRAINVENVPFVVVPLDMKRSEIRTSPPTPQCFSATRDPISMPAPPPSSGISKSRLLKERQPFKELIEQTPMKPKGEEEEEQEELMKSNGKMNCTSGIIASKEAKSLDVFWLFKPCALSS